MPSSRSRYRAVEGILQRTRQIEKASRGGPRDANLHLDTLRVVAAAPPQAEPVVLVDDVITSGAQMVGAARRLRATFPGLTRILGFALIRTAGEAEFGRIRDPVRRMARVTSENEGICRYFDLEPGSG